MIFSPTSLASPYRELPSFIAFLYICSPQSLNISAWIIYPILNDHSATPSCHRLLLFSKSLRGTLILHCLPQTVVTAPPNSTAAHRAAAIANHFHSTQTLQPAEMAAPERDPITCHVLNTVTGTPGSDISVTLKNISAEASFTESYTAKTNSDGRVISWVVSGDTQKPLMQTHAEHKAQGATELHYSMVFQTRPYFEGLGHESFFPEVEIKFIVKPGERHYHVPLLLSPWSYTTYRGS